MNVDCPKELAQQSPHHLYGTVQDDEPIVYVLVDPDHYKNGELQKAAFSQTRLKEGTLSVCRAQHSSRIEIQREIIDKLLKGTPAPGRRKFVGLFRAICRDIRSITLEYPRRNRAICVIDDGQPNYKAHAHLSYSAIAGEKDYWARNSRQAVRANLIDAFGKGNVLSLDEVFSS
jgi:hypothetical protein